MKTEFRDGANVVLPRDRYILTAFNPTTKASVKAKSENLQSLIAMNTQLDRLGYELVNLGPDVTP